MTTSALLSYGLYVLISAGTTYLMHRLGLVPTGTGGTPTPPAQPPLIDPKHPLLSELKAAAEQAALKAVQDQILKINPPQPPKLAA
jgi:hypothetical protein